MPLYNIDIVETLYFFDEPLVFVGKVGLLPALFLKTDESGPDQEFVSCYIDEKHIDGLKDGRISIRGIFEAQSDIFVVTTDFSYAVAHEERVGKDVLQETGRLPKPGVGLFHRMGECPDVLQEKDSLMSIYFKGVELGKNKIAYSTLMYLLGTVQNFARNVIAPPELRGLRNSTFDFNVGDPALGSLMISIKEPTYNLGKLRSGSSRRMITGEEVREGVKRHKDELFSEMEGLIDSPAKTLADGGDETYQNLKSLLPSDHTPYQSVTFSTSIDDGFRRISIDRARAEAVRAVHDRRNVTAGPRSGVIIEINSASSTFLIKSRKTGRVTTCAVSREEFEALRSKREFRLGSRAKVSGDFFERPRRDYMWVRRVDELEAS